VTGGARMTGDLPDQVLRDLIDIPPLVFRPEIQTKLLLILLGQPAVPSGGKTAVFLACHVADQELH
jgi:hypothetical protein